MLRERGKTRAHLPCLAEGAKAVPRERRRSRDAATRLVAELEAIAAAAEEGLKQHDRWLLARTLLLRKLDGRRSTSRLPELIEFVLSRPLISAGMIGKELGVTPRAAQNLVAELACARPRAGDGIGRGASCERGILARLRAGPSARRRASPSIRPADFRVRGGRAARFKPAPSQRCQPRHAQARLEVEKLAAHACSTSLSFVEHGAMLNEIVER